MKIKYITEGYFKNPEQAKAAREIASKEDNATSLAKLATKLLGKPLSEILTEAIALDESTESWYEGIILNSQVFDQLSLAFTFTEKTLNGKIIPTAEARIQDDGIIYIDFYFKINSEKIMNHFNSDAENITRTLITWGSSYACNAFGPNSTVPPKLKKTLGLVGKLKDRVKQMRWLNRDNNLKAAWQLFIHTPERKIKINKIHIFGDCVGDVYMSAYDDLQLVKESIPVMTEFFSFENKGEVYFVRRIFSWDHNYQGGGDEGREFKIYKIEGNTLKDYRIIGK